MAGRLAGGDVAADWRRKPAADRRLLRACRSPGESARRHAAERQRDDVAMGQRRSVRRQCGERESGPAGDLQIRTSTGQYHDAETGMHYNYFRDYDPVIGRYEQSDPIRFKGGTNTDISYADGTPSSKKRCIWPNDILCAGSRLHACGNTWQPAVFRSDIPGNPFYHQYLCVIDPNGNTTCGGQDRTGNPLSSAGKPSEDYCPYNRPDMCRKADLAQIASTNVFNSRIRSPERPNYGIPFGTDCQEWSDDVLRECQAECSCTISVE